MAVAHSSRPGHDPGARVPLPSPARLARDVALHLGEAVLIPLGLFYSVLIFAGLTAALFAALGWGFAAVGARLWFGGTPPLLLVAATGMVAVQVGVAAWADSAVAYFLQPTIATYLFGGAMLVTLPLDRPLIQRLANDFCPLPPHVVTSVPVRRFFQRLSLLWGGVLVANASVTLGLLLTIPAVRSVPIATAASVPLFALALVASWAWFRGSMRDGGFTVHWGHH